MKHLGSKNVGYVPEYLIVIDTSLHSGSQPEVLVLLGVILQLPEGT